MPEFRTSRRVRHAAEQMFALVADVERYPEFVPLCQGLRVLRRAEGEGSTEIVTASMTVAYKLLRETFTSRVTLDKANLRITVDYLDGPFRRLNNVWSFRPLSAESSEVEFYISYEFRSRMLAMVMGAVFDTAFRTFADAFERRADALYKPQPA